MSNMGNMGDMGDMGNVGNLGSAGPGGSFVPDRVDLPFSTEQARTFEKVGDSFQWILIDPAKDVSGLPRIAITEWPQREWAANWAAWLVLDEFVATNWRSIQLTLWDPTQQDAEIASLIRAAQDERPDALGEILAQNATYEDIMAYFLALLRITPNSHPKTARLLHIAGLVGLQAAMHFKQNPGNSVKPRARPSQVCPALLPSVEVPGHPSFPSGHATQSLLMALCVEAAMPDPLKAAWRPLLQTLAWRIARNREIAGLHYRSDTTAGNELAAQCFNKLEDGVLFKGVQAEALLEWQ